MADIEHSQVGTAGQFLLVDLGYLVFIQPQVFQPSQASQAVVELFDFVRLEFEELKVRQT